MQIFAKQIALSINPANLVALATGGQSSTDTIPELKGYDVKNIGNDPKMLDASSQKLIDSQGREFNASHAFGALPDAAKVFLENVNPGNSVKDAPLVFDVPKDVKLDSIELHDSMFSGGVKVSLK